jgi:hypothetical protein
VPRCGRSWKEKADLRWYVQVSDRRGYKRGAYMYSGQKVRVAKVLFSEDLLDSWQVLVKQKCSKGWRWPPIEPNSQTLQFHSHSSKHRNQAYDQVVQ